MALLWRHFNPTLVQFKHIYRLVYLCCGPTFQSHWSIQTGRVWRVADAERFNPTLVNSNRVSSNRPVLSAYFNLHWSIQTQSQNRDIYIVPFQSYIGQFKPPDGNRPKRSLQSNWSIQTGGDGVIAFRLRFQSYIVHSNAWRSVRSRRWSISILQWSIQTITDLAGCGSSISSTLVNSKLSIRYIAAPFLISITLVQFKPRRLSQAISTAPTISILH